MHTHVHSLFLSQIISKFFLCYFINENIDKYMTRETSQNPITSIRDLEILTHVVDTIWSVTNQSQIKSYAAIRRRGDSIRIGIISKAKVNRYHSAFTPFTIFQKTPDSEYAALKVYCYNVGSFPSHSPRENKQFLSTCPLFRSVINLQFRMSDDSALDFKYREAG